ncbi:GYD domain-containing protein [Halorussus aquaticus]|uniref:GYD domain-containing protein n=1 Tax=Halorussus aquaticus TaxID=2953748 RepID=UPI0020B6A2F3|nr:GYD domain-containing protein [Halorussus aquaticus]
MLGEYDFLVVMEAPDRTAAYQAGVALERHGLDAQTMEIIPTEELAEVVDDL